MQGSLRNRKPKRPRTLLLEEVGICAFLPDTATLWLELVSRIHTHENHRRQVF